MTETLISTTSPTASSSVARMRHTAAERRQEVVSAVIELARERGPAAITTQAIADRIGVTHGALFRHFPDKAAMWVAAFEWVQAELGGVVDTAFNAGGTPLEILERLFTSHVRFVARHPGVPRILFHELQAPPNDSPFRERARHMVLGYRRRLADLMQVAQSQGQLPEGLDTEAAAMLFVGAVQGLVVQSALFRGEAGMIAAARRIFPLLLDGFRGTSQR
jgi:TetR/AcrR family transcriptional regulator